MTSLNQPSIFKSILAGKCPKCRRGNLFETALMGNPSSWFSMKKGCGHCGQTFEPEPGFYFGAMFISYAFNTALFVAVWLIYRIMANEFSITILLLILGLLAIIFLPLFFRLSRTLWITFFVPYQGEENQLSDKP